MRTLSPFVACVAVTVAGLSACSSDTRKPAPTIGASPRMGQSGPGTTATSSMALPTCNSADLTLAGNLNGGAGSIVIYFVAVTSHQVHPCQVDEHLSVRILKDATGPALPIKRSPLVYTAHEIVLGPNQIAQAGDPLWAWENWCGPSGPAYVVAASAPGLAPLELELNGSLPACLDRTRPSVILPFTSAGPAPFKG